MAAGFSRLSIRNHMGIRSIAVKMFIIHIFNSVQPFSVVVTASVIHGIAIARPMCANNPDQLFGVGALAHRGLPPDRGLVRGPFPAPHHHDPNETLPNFPIWVMVGSSSTDWFHVSFPCVVGILVSRWGGKGVLSYTRYEPFTPLDCMVTALS